MFVVKTKLGQSRIHGVGVFAEEDIPKGAIVWKLHDGFDFSFHEERLNELEAVTREQLLRYSYKDKFNPGWYVHCAGHAVFINHSYSPNTGSAGAVEIALRDIKAGEELTSDYREWCGDFDPHEDCAGEIPTYLNGCANGASVPIRA